MFQCFYEENKFMRCDFGESEYILTKLRYLHWEGYPLKSLHWNIRAVNLSLLELPNSKVEPSWDGVQVNFNIYIKICY